MSISRERFKGTLVISYQGEEDSSFDIDSQIASIWNDTKHIINEKPEIGKGTAQTSKDIFRATNLKIKKSSNEINIGYGVSNDEKFEIFANELDIDRALQLEHISKPEVLIEKYLAGELRECHQGIANGTMIFIQDNLRYSDQGHEYTPVFIESAGIKEINGELEIIDNDDAKVISAYNYSVDLNYKIAMREDGVFCALNKNNEWEEVSPNLNDRPDDYQVICIGKTSLSIDTSKKPVERQLVFEITPFDKYKNNCWQETTPYFPEIRQKEDIDLASTYSDSDIEIIEEDRVTTEVDDNSSLDDYDDMLIVDEEWQFARKLPDEDTQHSKMKDLIRAERKAPLDSKFERLCSPELISIGNEEPCLYSRNFVKTISEYETNLGTDLLNQKIRETLEPVVKKKLTSGVKGFFRRIGNFLGLYSLKDAVDSKVKGIEANIKTDVSRRKNQIESEELSVLRDSIKVNAVKNDLNFAQQTLIGLINRRHPSSDIIKAKKDFMSILERPENKKILENSLELRRHALMLINVITSTIDESSKKNDYGDIKDMIVESRNKFLNSFERQRSSVEDERRQNNDNRPVNRM